MTKKDYELIAEAIARASEPVRTPNGKDVFYSIVNSIAYSLQEENVKFDRTKFSRACGLKV